MLSSFSRILSMVLGVLSPFIEVNGKLKMSIPKLLALIVAIAAVGTILEMEISTPTGTPSMAESPAGTTETNVFEEKNTSSVVPGDVCTFGTYEGKPIDWKVLDVQNNKAFLLSTKALECIKYHNIEHETVTWGSCSLREWLNGTFLATAFSNAEQAAIITTTVDNGTDQGNPEWTNTGSGQTEDQVFLLSYAEFVRYVKGRNFSVCEAAYSTKTGEDTRVQLLDNGTEAAFWWLRSPGENGKQAAFINFEGKCYSNFATNWYLSARPAMWVDLEKMENL